SAAPDGVLRWIPPALIALMAVGMAFLAPSGEKAGPAIAGIIVAGLGSWGLGMAPSWLFWRDDAARDLLVRAAAGLGLLVLVDAWVPDPVLSSYVVMGGLLGMACTALP